MAITLITGPANAGKARAVLDGVRGHLARGEEPWLVVPTQADVERYRRELAEGGLVLGIRVERFKGLLAEVVDRAGVGGRALSPLLRERILAAVAARTSAAPEIATRPGFVRALAALVAELEVERVTPTRWRRALRAWAGGGGGGGAGDGAGARDGDGAGGGEVRAARAEELGALFEGYHALLEELGRVDLEHRAARALDAVRREPALWGSTPVLLYGFDDLTRLQLDTIETLGRVADAPLTLSLSYEPGRIAFGGRAGAFQTLLPWVSEHRALEARAEHYAPSARIALHALERSLFELETEERAGYGDTDVADADRRIDPAGAVRLLEGGSPRAELELVAGEIRALLDRGIAPGEIAIVHRSPRDIAPLLAEVLGEFEIPHVAPLRLSFGDTALGRALCGLLVSACGGEPGMSQPGRLEDLLAWLRAPGLLQRPELADRLEAQARRTGLSSAAQGRALWEAEHWPLATLDHVLAAAQRGPLALIERATSELQWLFRAPRRRAAAVLSGPMLGEAAALVEATRALEELAELARAAPRLAPNPGELVAILRGLELSVGGAPGLTPGAGAGAEDGARPGETRIEAGAGDGARPGETRAEAGAVAVLSPLALRARRVRALFLCGLQEGVFPAPARAQPLLSEEERRGLAEASGLALSAPEETLAAERYLLYAACSRPQELLALSWHVADEDGEPTPHSLFVDDVCDLFSEDLRHGRSRRVAGAASWPGPGARLTAWDAREAALAGPRQSPPVLAPLRDQRLLGELRQDRLWSASSLQSWAGCPAQWFVERLLRAEDLDPEAEPLARGGLAHAALKDTLEGLRRRFGSARLTPVRLPAARALLHEALARHGPDFPLSVAPERIPGVRRRLEADLERYLEHAALQESPLEPTHLELDFGFGGGEGQGARGEAEGRDEAAGAGDEAKGEGSLTLPPLDLGQGLRVRGRIDRIDIAPSGEAVVYDYKGSHAPPAEKWVPERSLQLALYIRAVQELLGRPVLGGFYQPLAGRDLRARGVLSAAAGFELACLRGDLREPDDVEELLDETLALARAAAREADAGALQARPGTCGFGDFGCRYPSICRSQR